jgi:hypothetical protein
MKAKKTHICFSVCLISGILTGCIKNPEFTTDVKNAGKPVLEKVEVVAKTASSISLKGKVTDANGYPVTERGFCWDTNPLPEAVPDRMRSAGGEGTGEFTTTIENLKGNTHYYIRPYAKNEMGIGYGEQDSVITNDGLGKVRTLTPQNIRAKTAVCSGKIEFPGEGAIEERGVYISTSANMENKTPPYHPVTINGDTFICNISGLNHSTQYYVLAFVRNTFGTFSGDTIGFMTSDGRPVVDSVEIIVGYTDVIMTSYVVDGGDAPVLERGFCWDDIPNPTIESSTPKNRISYAGPGIGAFAGQTEGLDPQTKYYIRAFARNEFGLKYSEKQTEFYTKSETPTVKTSEPASTINGTVILGGQILDKGKSDVTSSGICYSSSVSEPSITNGDKKELVPESSGVFSTELSGLKGGTTYYVRAYATNDEGTSYGETIRFETPPVFSGGLSAFQSESRMPGSPAYFMIGSKGYLLGGDIGPQCTNELWSYDASENNWKQLQSYPKGNAKWQSAVTHNTNVYVLGGWGDNYEKKNDFYQYDSFNNMWNSLPAGPDSAYLRTGFLWEDEICYAGGMKDTAKNEVWAFDINMNTWSQKANFPIEQYGGIALNVNNSIYAGLGKNTAGVCNKTLWQSSDLLTWTQESVHPSITGGVIAGVVYKNKIYVVDESSYIFEYDPVTKQWHTKSLLPINSVHCMYVMNNLIYIGVGSSNSLIVYNPMWDN